MPKAARKRSRPAPTKEAPDPRRMLDAVKAELKRRAGGGRLSFRFVRAEEDAPEILLTLADGVKGYATVFVAWESLREGTRGGLTADRELPADAEVFYSARVYAEPWTTADERLWSFDPPFNSASSPDVSEIADLVMRWVDPPPARRAPAVGAKERRRLAAIAAGRRGRFTPDQRRRCAGLRSKGRLADAFREVGLEPAFDLKGDGTGLTPAGRAALAEDLRHLLPDQLVWNLPAGDDGRWPLGEHVLLGTYPAAKRLGRLRSLWLAARTPRRRGDEQVVRLVIEPLIGENHAHRWDGARWLWDERQADAGEARRWGVGGLPVGRLRPEAREKQLSELRAACRNGRGTPGQRAALAILLQDAGEPEAALAVWGVEVGEDVRRAAGGLRVGGYCADEARWPEVVRRAMRRCAPWLLASAVAAVRPWAGVDVPLQRGRLHFKLAILPGQHHQRKASLLLAAPDRSGRALRLEIAATASNKVLPHVAWQRPIEIDLRRYGLEDDAP